MASVRLNGDTSGFIEISAPNVAGSTTITLPATSGGDFLVTDSNGDLNVDSGTLFVDASTNRVGVGTTSPSTNLQVDGSWVSNYGTVNITGPDDGLIGVGLRNSSTYLGGVFFRDGTAGDFLELNVQGSRSIRALINGSEALRIDSSGRVGIGASSPSDVLHVVGDGGASDNSATSLAESASKAKIRFQNRSGSSLSEFQGTVNSGDTWYSQIANSTGTSSYNQVLNPFGGNVGIGIQNPGFRLEVESSANDIARFVGPNSGNIVFRNSTNNELILHTGNSDALIFGTNGNNERARVHSDGYFLFGTQGLPGPSIKGAGFYTDTNNTQLLLASSSTSSTAHVEFFNTNGKVGTITTSGSSTSYNTSSDYRLKENVVDLDGAINRVKQLAPKRFNFIADASKTVDGFLAHEAQTVVPEAVTGTHNEVDDEDNPVYQGIDQAKLVPLLTAALQEAIGKIEALETTNASLEARLTALEGGN